MEIEDSDSEASDVGMTEAQKAACCKYLNGLEELELTQNKPVKKKPAMSHDSTPPRKGSTGNSTVTPALASTTSSVSTGASTLTLVFTTPSFAEVAAKIPMTLHPLFSENKNTMGQKQQKTYIYGKFKISIPPMDQLTATIHGKLIKISTLLQEIDPTFIYCHYDPDKNLAVHYTSSDKDIPSRISELQIFHPTLKPNPTQNDIWAQAWISFDQDRATFLQDMGGSLMGIKSVFYENALQVPHSSKNYMLMQSHPSLNATKHLQVLKNIMFDISVTEKRPKSIVFTLKVKSVMDGKCSKMTGPKDTSSNRIINKKACYIIFEKGHEKDGSRLLALALKTKKYAEHCRMGISLIPKYNQFASNTICCKVLGNINRHYKIQVNLQHCILETMVNIDKYNETLKSTGHQLLMKMMHPSNLVTLALLAVNTKEWGGNGIILTFPKSYEDISKDAPYTPAMLYHTYGEEAFCWMSADGIEDAKETVWDNTTNHLILIEEQLTNTAMNEECPAWAMLEIENVALINQDKQRQGPDVAQQLEHADIDLENNSNSTFGIGNQTIASPQANDEITLDSTLQTKTATTPHQGTQMGPNSSPSVVNALSMLSPEDPHHLLHLAQQMNLPAEMAKQYRWCLGPGSGWLEDGDWVPANSPCRPEPQSPFTNRNTAHSRSNPPTTQNGPSLPSSSGNIN